MTTPAERDLPPLPSPDLWLDATSTMRGYKQRPSPGPWFDVDSMHAYARAALASSPAQPMSNDAAIGGFAIEIEKLLCDKLGISWSAGGISIESLVNRLASAQAVPSPAPATSVANPYPKTHWEHGIWQKGYEGVEFQGLDWSVVSAVYAEGAAARQGVQVAPSLAPVPSPAPSLIWSYRRYGSPPEKGYTIIAGLPGRLHGDAVAFLGDGPEAGDAAHAICEAHNAALAAPVAQPEPTVGERA